MLKSVAAGAVLAPAVPASVAALDLVPRAVGLFRLAPGDYCLRVRVTSARTGTS
jgi:hypothetical protein